MNGITLVGYVALYVALYIRVYVVVSVRAIRAVTPASGPRALRARGER